MLYFQMMVTSLLCLILDDTYQVLYSYQLHMSLLTKIASSSEGSEILLRCNIFDVLEKCDFLDNRPEVHDFDGTYF